jgi:hypothetical protein
MATSLRVREAGPPPARAATCSPRMVSQVGGGDRNDLLTRLWPVLLRQIMARYVLMVLRQKKVRISEVVLYDLYMVVKTIARGCSASSISSIANVFFFETHKFYWNLRIWRSPKRLIKARDLIIKHPVCKRRCMILSSITTHTLLHATLIYATSTVLV